MAKGNCKYCGKKMVSKPHTDLTRWRYCSAGCNRAQWRIDKPFKREQELARRKKNGRRKDILWRLRVTEEEYEQMAKKQSGTCKICARLPGHKYLFVDHDHITGITRGLLCDRCNYGLGNFNDDPKLIRKAANYLINHGKKAKRKRLKSKILPMYAVKKPSK